VALPWRLDIAVQTPAHAALGDLLSYSSAEPMPPGTLVRVPLGKREVLGVVWNEPVSLEGAEPDMALKPVGAALNALAPLGEAWRDLVAFAARYYQRSIGEIALAALPPQLRDLSTTQLARRLKRKTTAGPVAETAESANLIALSAEQAAALAAIEATPDTATFLLVGSTGSGKTEVYLRCVADLLARDPAAQALVMVPEINLTPQLEARFKARFGEEAVVSLHSGMTNPQRLASWLAAHGGAARIVLGTRMAVFASIPGLKLIVVDEEHDPSYKQQEARATRRATSPCGVASARRPR
jgi:primosomal protein N' (replication factor Y)